MISSFRNFAKTKFAGLLVFIMIIPFVFWGMGSMFSSGNTNTIAKINKKNISTQEFIDYLNSSGIPKETIRENLKNNIINELLSGLISTSLLELEIQNYNLLISKNILLKKIKENENFLDENGMFQRIKYEKFLLENNQSAPQFELRLKNRELQKNLFDYIGAGTISPKFMIKKLYEEENKQLEIDYVNLESFYEQKESLTDSDLMNFISNNKDQLKIEYLDFSYAILNPKNTIGVDEFNQSYFNKIDQIEIDISNEIEFDIIVNDLKINPIKKNNFKISSKSTEIEKKIFELRENQFDIFENGEDYILYKIEKRYEREPDINDKQTKDEIKELVYEKNKFDYNKLLIDRIRNKDFNDNAFIEMAKNKLQTANLNSIRDNKKFDINAVKLLYSMPVNSFTLINDEKNNIYIAKVKKFIDKTFNEDEKEMKNYLNKQNSNSKNLILKSYDLYLNSKYQVELNQQTIERVTNFFQ